jgi:hypothetical protein
VVAALLVRVRVAFFVVAGFVFFAPRVLPALTSLAAEKSYAS